MIVFGEVHTGLIQHSHALPSRDVAQLLALVAGERVRQSTRPVAYALSPEVYTGLDCGVATASGRIVRVVGTVVCRATVLGGHILQGSTFTELRNESDKRRRPWAHYLAHPGVLKTVGKAKTERLMDGFLATPPTSGLLDLGALSGRTIDIVQRAGLLNRRAPFRTTRTKLRWVADLPGGEETRAASSGVTFALVDPQLRTLAMTCRTVDIHHAVQLCEDLALHDWLLTTVINLVERAQIGGRPRQQVIVRLQPVIDYLAHLWMPPARLHPDVAQVWRHLEERPGFTHQWQSLITRIRDQLTLASLSPSYSEGRVPARL